MKKHKVFIALLCGALIVSSPHPSVADWKSANFDQSLYAAAYGMKCDGVTDDTAAFQNAVNNAPKKTLIIPPGVCIISSTVNFTSNSSYHVIGQGSSPVSSLGSTALKWNGPSGTNGPLLYLKGVRDSSFRGFMIENGSSTNRLGTAIMSETVSGVVTTGNYYDDITINGTNGYIDYGFRYVAGTGGDNNNDVNVFNYVRVINFAIAAWSFEHSQSKGHLFYGCHYEGVIAGTTPNGVTTNLGGGFGGSFSWFGGGGGGVGVDFNLGTANDAILISGGNWEGSGRLLTVPFSGASWMITVEGSRWADNGLNADGKVIIHSSAQGTLNLIGNTFGAGGKAVTLNVQGYGIAIGNQINTTQANPFVCGSATCAWYTVHNILNVNTALPDTIGYAAPAITTAAIGSGCGTGSPAIGGPATQNSFQLTCGSTAVSSFTITWPVKRLTKPTCNITPETSAAAAGMAITTSNTTTLTVSWTTSVASTAWDVTCNGS